MALISLDRVRRIGRTIRQSPRTSFLCACKKVEFGLLGKHASPRAYNHPQTQAPPSTPTPKPGFFARLFGRKSHQPQMQFEPPRYPQPQDGQPAHLEHLGQGDRTRPQAPLRTHRRNDDEKYEMPTFFGADRK